MVKSCGCKIVEIGHAERYKYFNETDILVNKKIIQAINNNLIPLVCFGEEKKISNLLLRKKELIKKIKIMFKSIKLKKNKKIILAYEPVWAIGTGKTATPEQANSMHLVIRNQLAELANEQFATKMRILYGGSVNADNAEELLGQSEIDGALVGGASLKTDQFPGIITAAKG